MSVTELIDKIKAQVKTMGKEYDNLEAHYMSRNDEGSQAYRDIRVSMEEISLKIEALLWVVELAHFGKSISSL